MSKNPTDEYNYINPKETFDLGSIYPYEVNNSGTRQRDWTDVARCDELRRRCYLEYSENGILIKRFSPEWWMNRAKLEDDVYFLEADGADYRISFSSDYDTPSVDLLRFGLRGDNPGSILVYGCGKADVIRDGDGQGDAKNYAIIGDAIRCGNGAGSAIRKSRTYHDTGSAIRKGGGTGDAISYMMSEGNAFCESASGNAIHLWGKDGNAIRGGGWKYSSGHAIRISDKPGMGNSIYESNDSRGMSLFIGLHGDIIGDAVYVGGGGGIAAIYGYGGRTLHHIESKSKIYLIKPSMFHEKSIRKTKKVCKKWKKAGFREEYKKLISETVEMAIRDALTYDAKNVHLSVPRSV